MSRIFQGAMAKRLLGAFLVWLLVLIMTGPQGNGSKPTAGLTGSFTERMSFFGFFDPQRWLTFLLLAVVLGVVVYALRALRRTWSSAQESGAAVTGAASKMVTVSRRLHRLRSGRYSEYVVLVALALALPHVITSQSWQTNIVQEIAVYVLLAIGLNVVTGFAGLLDLGYVAFYAIGAYTTAWVTGALPTPPPFHIHFDTFFAIPFAIVFAMLFAVALTQVKGKPKETMLNFFEGLSEVMFKFTSMVMLLAPFGVGAAIAVTVGHSGLGVLVNLGKLVGTLYGALLIFVLAVLLPVAMLAKIPVRRFFRHVKDPALIAFSTTSSAAALPLALENMEKFGVPKRIVAFVLPAGYSFNLDGSTLYLAVASVYVAQAAGVHMTLSQQLVMMLTLMLTSKGVAAVPRATLVILSGTLVTFGLPLEGVALILGVDTLMDMARTTVNLIGNCLASAVMARWEGELKIPAENSEPSAH